MKKGPYRCPVPGRYPKGGFRQHRGRRDRGPPEALTEHDVVLILGLNLSTLQKWRLSARP